LHCNGNGNSHGNGKGNGYATAIMVMVDGNNRGDSNVPLTIKTFKKQQSTSSDGYGNDDSNGINNGNIKQQHHRWHLATVTPSIKYHSCNAELMATEWHSGNGVTSRATARLPQQQA